MSFLDAIVLSIIEGLTEFLPISSTGHLILAGKLLGLATTEFVKSFEIIIQLGAILAVVFLYRRTLFSSVKIWQKIIVAFLPTGILGLVFYRLIKQYLLGSATVVLWSLFLGGIALIILEKFFKEEKAPLQKSEDLSYGHAVLIGLFQSLAMIPGVSRAAATIFGGMFLGMERRAAVEFSFFLAVPTMLAASGWDLLKTGWSFTAEEILILSIGFVGSFTVAYFTVKYFIKYIQTHTFIPFGVYRIIVAILFWLIII
ncbi:MAG: undecaprenyl-diphosphate phosphatase [bacterium]|nr:undecaprenyl-diphosphate phosphatase [bacterium]